MQDADNNGDDAQSFNTDNDDEDDDVQDDERELNTDYLHNIIRGHASSIVDFENKVHNNNSNNNDRNNNIERSDDEYDDDDDDDDNTNNKDENDHESLRESDDEQKNSADGINEAHVDYGDVRKKNKKQRNHNNNNNNKNTTGGVPIKWIVLGLIFVAGAIYMYRKRQLEQAESLKAIEDATSAAVISEAKKTKKDETRSAKEKIKKTRSRKSMKDTEEGETGDKEEEEKKQTLPNNNKNKRKKKNQHEHATNKKKIQPQDDNEKGDHDHEHESEREDEREDEGGTEEVTREGDDDHETATTHPDEHQDENQETSNDIHRDTPTEPGERDAHEAHPQMGASTTTTTTTEEETKDDTYLPTEHFHDTHKNSGILHGHEIHSDFDHLVSPSPISMSSDAHEEMQSTMQYDVHSRTPLQPTSTRDLLLSEDHSTPDMSSQTSHQHHFQESDGDITPGGVRDSARVDNEAHRDFETKDEIVYANITRDDLKKSASHNSLDKGRQTSIVGSGSGTSARPITTSPDRVYEHSVTRLAIPVQSQPHSKGLLHVSMPAATPYLLPASPCLSPLPPPLHLLTPLPYEVEKLQHIVDTKQHVIDEMQKSINQRDYMIEALQKIVVDNRLFDGHENVAASVFSRPQTPLHPSLQQSQSSLPLESKTPFFFGVDVSSSPSGPPELLDENKKKTNKNRHSGNYTKTKPHKTKQEDKKKEDGGSEGEVQSQHKHMQFTETDAKDEEDGEDNYIKRALQHNLRPHTTTTTSSKSRIKASASSSVAALLKAKRKASEYSKWSFTPKII